MYILDTDHVGILQLAGGREYLALSQRIALCSQTDLYVTIVSLHEQFLGWNAYKCCRSMKPLAPGTWSISSESPA